MVEYGWAVRVYENGEMLVLSLTKRYITLRARAIDVLLRVAEGLEEIVISLVSYVGQL